MSAHWEYFEFRLSHYRTQLSNLKDLDAQLANDLHNYRHSGRIQVDETALDFERQHLQAGIAALLGNIQRTRVRAQGMISAEELVALDSLENWAQELYVEAFKRPERARKSLRVRLCDEDCCVVS